MMQSHSVQTRRVIAIVLLLVLVFLFVIAVVMPAWQYYHQQAEQIDQMQSHLQRFRQLTHGGVVDGSQSLPGQPSDTAGLFLSGKTPAIAAAGMQDLVKSLVQKSGGQLISVSNIDSKNDESVAEVGVEVSMQGDMYALQAVLYALEAHTPLLKISKLSLQQNMRRDRGRRTNRRNQEDVTIAIRFTVSGYFLPGNERSDQ